VNIELPRSILGRSDSEMAARLLLVVAVAIIIAAQLFEHVGGFRPCELCLLERKTWYFAAPAALAALFVLHVGRPGLARLLLAVMALVFVLNAGLAFYHAGMEWGWWTGPASCTGAVNLATDPEALLRQVQTEDVVRCDVAQFRLLGISFAGYDCLMSLAAAVVAIVGARGRQWFAAA
jgi:disulfide bond formation protein DsbB